MPKLLYILHENEEWLSDLRKSLDSHGVEYICWFVDSGVNGESLDFTQPPPEGVFYNRVSCSSHTRDHKYSVRYTEMILQWLELYGRTVINGVNSFNIETNKTLQHVLLQQMDIPTPLTYTCTDTVSIVSVAEKLGQFIIKDNQGGSGSGVYRFRESDKLQKLQQHLKSHQYPISPDKITLVQEYITSPSNTITRVEIVGGKHLYSLTVDTQGGFNLCPASSCQITNCPIKCKGDKFVIKDTESDTDKSEGHSQLRKKFTDFAEKHKLQIVAFEYITDQEGNHWTYDINCNTNYNSSAEKKWGKDNYAWNAVSLYFKKLVSTT